MTADDILKLRSRLRMTRKDLAAYLAISPTTLLKYERGEIAVPKLVALGCRCLVDGLRPYGEG